MVDVDYKPKMTLVREKLRSFVRFDNTSTVDKRQKIEKISCTKGPERTLSKEIMCRISNNRLKGQIKRLAELSPKIDDSIIDIQMLEGVASIGS